MRKIKGKNTTPEKQLRKALWAKGIRYRLNVSKLPGKPDIVVENRKVAIFIDGEFWHGYKWSEKRRRIKGNRDYWIKKIEGNIQRDERNNKALKILGYKVFRFWEHQIRLDTEGCVVRVLNYIATHAIDP